MAKRVYCHIDTLLDLRWGALHTLGLTKNIDLEMYSTRQHDDWAAHGLATTMEEVNALISSGDPNVLTNSIVTPMFDTLAESSNNIDTGALQNEEFDMDLVVNTYPYVLSEDVKQAFAGILATKIRMSQPVRFVSWSNSILFPHVINRDFDALFMYNWDTWYSDHLKELVEHPMPTVVLVVPCISFQSAAKLHTAKKQDPFLMTERSLTPFIAIHMQDIKQFNFAL